MPSPSLQCLAALAVLCPSVTAQITTTANPIGCARSLVDQASGACLRASTVPTLGQLFPLSNDLFIDMTNGFVGMGTTTPDQSLQIGEFFQTSRDNLIEMRTIGGPGAEFRQGLKMRSSNPFFGFNIEHDDALKGLNLVRYDADFGTCLLYTSPSPRDRTRSRMPSSA